MDVRFEEHRWWAAVLLVLGSVGLATCFLPAPGFRSSYVLDIVGPAWNYILLRGLFTNKPTPWSRFFTPNVTPFRTVRMRINPASTPSPLFYQPS